MEPGVLGREYADGEVIVRQGEPGDCMFVVQEGEIEVLAEGPSGETHLRTAKQGEFLGEIAIFERINRTATLRATGKVRLLTIDKKNFLRRIHEDPSLAFRIVQNMSSRIRELSDEVTRLKHELGE